MTESEGHVNTSKVKQQKHGVMTEVEGHVNMSTVKQGGHGEEHTEN